MIPEMNFNPTVQVAKYFDLCRTKGNIDISRLNEKSVSLDSSYLHCEAFNEKESVLYQMHTIFQKDNKKGAALVIIGMEKISIDPRTGEESEPVACNFAQSYQIGFYKDGTPAARETYQYFEEGSVEKLFNILARNDWHFYKMITIFNAFMEKGQNAVMQERYDLYDRLLMEHRNPSVRLDGAIDAASDIKRDPKVPSATRSRYLTKWAMIAYPDGKQDIKSRIRTLEMLAEMHTPQTPS
jgi:hypothetical protein